MRKKPSFDGFFHGEGMGFAQKGLDSLKNVKDLKVPDDPLPAPPLLTKKVPEVSPPKAPVKVKTVVKPSAPAEAPPSTTSSLPEKLSVAEIKAQWAAASGIVNEKRVKFKKVVVSVSPEQWEKAWKNIKTLWKGKVGARALSAYCVMAARAFRVMQITPEIYNEYRILRWEEVGKKYYPISLRLHQSDVLALGYRFEQGDKTIQEDSDYVTLLKLAGGDMETLPVNFHGPLIVRLALAQMPTDEESLRRLYVLTKPRKYIKLEEIKKIKSREGNP